MATMLLGACDNVYPELYAGDDNVAGTGENSVTASPVKVYISNSNFVNVTSKSGVGAFDKNDDFTRYENHYRNLLLSTYAYRSTNGGADFTRTMGNDPRADNCLLSSLSGTGGMPTRLVDRYPDGEAEGQQMYFYETEASESPTTIYYNPEKTEEGYNFFTYSFDNAVVSAPRTENGRISYDVTIDGTQDIMAGHAPKMSMQLLNTRYSDTQHNSLTEADKSAIASLEGYSAYASHRNVDPVIDLKHMLSRLRFKAYPGNKDCESVTITGIDILSETTGRIIVASRNLDEVGVASKGDIGTITLYEESTDGITPCQPFEEKTLEWVDGDERREISDRTAITLGGSVLLFPDETYTMILHYKQKVAATLGSPDTKVIDYSGKYTIKPLAASYNKDPKTETYMFRPGLVYTVAIVVYGLERIEVTPSIEAWKDGGTIIRDDN